MSKLLSYLRALFKLSGSQAMPASSSAQSVILQSDSQWHDLIAPFDGYLTVRTGGDSGTFRAIEFENESCNLQAKIIPEQEIKRYAGGFIVFKKGDSLSYIVANIQGNPGIYAYFIPTAGSS